MDDFDPQEPKRQLLDFSRWVLSWKELPPDRELMNKARLNILNDLLSRIRVLEKKLLRDINGG